MIFFARLISVLSNPLLVFFPASYLLVYKTSNNASYALEWSLFSLFFGIITMLFILYGIKKGFFSDIDVSVRQQRKLLFVFAVIIVFLYALSILLLKGPNILLVALSGILLGILLTSIINSKVKASIHVAVFSAFAVSMSLLYGGIFIFGLLLIPLIAWSRIKIKKHTRLETVIGGLVGIFITFTVYLLVKYLVGI